MEVPLIGQGPTPEKKQEEIAQLGVISSLWPIHPYPMPGNGIRVPPQWMGQTLLDSFALTAAASFDWRMIVTNGPEKLEEAAKRVWQAAAYLMQTRPVGIGRPDPTEEKARPAGSGTEESSVDSDENKNVASLK